MTQLVRNTAEEWPPDAPPGTFDIEPMRLEQRPAVTARIIFVCPKAKTCAVLLGPVAEARRTPQELNVWGWDGNDTAPTITPSIDCVGGCGWHGVITAGVMR